MPTKVVLLMRSRLAFEFEIEIEKYCEGSNRVDILLMRRDGNEKRQ